MPLPPLASNTDRQPWAPVPIPSQSNWRSAKLSSVKLAMLMTRFVTAWTATGVKGRLLSNCSFLKKVQVWGHSRARRARALETRIRPPSDTAISNASNAPRVNEKGLKGNTHAKQRVHKDHFAPPDKRRR